MELLVGAVIIIVLCICLGVPLSTIAFFCGLALLGFTALLMLAFLCVTTAMLFSKKTEAQFVRTDKNKKGSFNVAYYLIGDTEYPCAFPSEMLFRNRLYSADKPCRVRFCRRFNCVFDRYASATCFIGSLFFLAMIAAAVCTYIFIIGV